MDRYDELLKKARQEMVEPAESHESVFELVWQGVEKGLFDGMRRGYGNTRRPIGAPVRNLSTPDQQAQYRSLMQYEPPAPPMVNPEPDIPEGDPVLDADRDPVDAGLDAMRRGGPSGPPPQEPGNGGPPSSPSRTRAPGPSGPPGTLAHPSGGTYGDIDYTKPPPLPDHPAPGFVPNTEATPPSLDGGHAKGTEAGMNALMSVRDTPPSMRQANPTEVQQYRDQGQEMGIVPYGHRFDDEGTRGTQLPPGKVPLQLPAPRSKDPVEEGMKQLQLPAPRSTKKTPVQRLAPVEKPVEEAWSPKLGESGTWGGHADHFNPKTKKLYGKRSKPYSKYQEWAKKQTGKAKETNTGDGGEETPKVEDPPKKKKKGINMPQLVDNETKQKEKPMEQQTLFPQTETPTDDESNKQRQQKRAEQRESGERPGLLEGLMSGEKKGGEEGGEDWPTSISQTTTPRDVVDAMYEAAQMGDEKALSSLRNNQADAEVVLGMDDGGLNHIFNKAQWQNADLSLLPSGLLKHIRNEPQQADADYSLLPRGWQEGVVQ